MPRMIYYYTKDKIEKAINNPVKFKREIRKAFVILNFDELDILKTWFVNDFHKNIEDLSYFKN